MSKMRLLMLSSLLIVTAWCSGQELNVATDTVRWKTTEFSDELVGSSGQSGDQFITYGASLVKWLPAPDGETIEIVYEVAHFENSGQAENAVYHLLRKGKPRVLEITQANACFTLTVSFEDNLGRTRSIVYAISEAEKLP